MTDSWKDDLAGEPRRFVVLWHQLPEASDRRSHWDWMFERDGRLLTWACPHWPAATTVEATRLPDHRLAYLDYEGPVSLNRGEVRRIFAGNYRLAPSEHGGEAPANPAAVRFRLEAPGLRGWVCLTPEPDRPEAWRLAYEPAGVFDRASAVAGPTAAGSSTASASTSGS